MHYAASELHYLGLLVLRDFFAPRASATSVRGPIGGMVALCILVRRAPYLAAGGFHEKLFFYFEDTDLAWRLRLLGHALWFEPDALVLHRGGTAGLSLRAGAAMPARRTYYHSRNRPAVLLTCLSWRSLLVLLPAQALYTAVHFAFALAQGHAFAWVRGRLALVALFPDVLRWRRAAQRARVVRDRDLLVAAPLTLNPGIAESKGGRRVRALLDRIYAGWWRLVRPLC